MKTKRILQIISIVLAVILIGFLIWFFFLRSTNNQGNEPNGGDVSIIEPPIPGGGNVPEPPLPGSGENVPGGEPGDQNGNVKPGTENPPEGGVNSFFEPTLRRVSEKPIAGSVIFNKGGRDFIRFTDRASGHIYETDAEIIKLQKISNTTVPKIYEAIWQPDGTGAVYRFIKNDSNISTFAGTIREAGKSGEFRGRFLSNNIKDLAVSKTNGSLLYFSENLVGSNILEISSFFGSNSSTLWTSPLSEWLPLWSDNGTPAVVSKASETSPGSLIILNKDGQIQDYLVNGIYGLSMSLSPNATQAVYSNSESKPISLWLQKKDTPVKRLNLNTLGEKCIWQDTKIVFCAVPERLPSGEYPDDWYQGIISFKDEIYSIDTNTGVIEHIINLSNAANQDFDVDLMAMSPDKRFLTLRNKNDLILWSLQLSK